MADSENVNIKLELSRDKSTGKLSLMVRFDTKADNLIVEKDTYAWLPTLEEIELINEAFGIFPKEKTITAVPSPEKIIEKHLEKPATKEEPEKKEDSNVEDSKEVEDKPSEKEKDPVEDTIERYKKEDGELLKEADEHTIIDKVLKEKKKGKWKKL